MKHLFTISLFVLLFANYGCQKSAYGHAQLNVDYISIEQTNYVQYLDISGPFVSISNPNFDENDPSTWTGDAAQYVVNEYSYTINYHISNSGNRKAKNVELDVGYFFDDGSDTFETFHIGDISANDERVKTVQIVVKDKQLEESAAEVYW